jgi:hypothetical protein
METRDGSAGGLSCRGAELIRSSGMLIFPVLEGLALDVAVALAVGAVARSVVKATLELVPVGRILRAGTAVTTAPRARRLRRLTRRRVMVVDL